MRTILCILFLAFSINLTAQNDIKWMKFEDAVAMARKQPKKIFIDMYTDWCGWCKVMDRTTFADTVIEKYMNENYYAVKFDAEQKEDVIFSGTFQRYDSLKKETITYQDTVVFKLDPSQGRKGTHQLALALSGGKLAYPSFVVLDENVNKIDMLQGYIEGPRFETILTYFGSNAYKGTPFTDYEKTFTPKAAPPKK